MTSAPLDRIAPAFVEMAHRIVWASAATVDAEGRPWSRVLHPLWSWDGGSLTGIVATSPLSPKRTHLESHPFVSFTYWHPSHDTCTAQCHAEWDLTDEGREAGWAAFASAPDPVGYDPSIVPGWDDPTDPAFAILRLPVAPPRHARHRDAPGHRRGPHLAGPAPGLTARLATV